MMTPGPDMWKVIVGVVLAAAISFVIAAPIVKMAGSKSLEDAQNEMAARKAEAKGTAVPTAEIGNASGVKKIIFACAPAWVLLLWAQRSLGNGLKASAQISRWQIHR